MLVISLFLKIWLPLIILNQLMIFGACFAPYCLLAALPHTLSIAAIVTYSLYPKVKENKRKHKAIKQARTISQCKEASIKKSEEIKQRERIGSLVESAKTESIKTRQRK